MVERRTLKASVAGLEIVDRAIKQRGWGRQSSELYSRAQVSLATLRRFWQRIPVGRAAFQGICDAAQVDWQLVAEGRLVRSTLEPVAEGSAEDSGEVWVGRESFLTDLVSRWQEGTRLLLVTGLTGVGKTALVEHLGAQLRQALPTQRTLNFDSYDQTTFSHMIPYLVGTPPDAALSTEVQVQAVADQLANQSSLVVLDSLEVALQGDETSGWSVFQDPQWPLFFRRWLALPEAKGLVVITSQEFPAELREIGSRYGGRWHCLPLKGLPEAEQDLLFRRLGLDLSPPDARHILQRIGAAYEGHPLTLQVIAGEILNEPFNGSVTAYWNTYRQEIETLEQAMQEMDPKGEEDDLRLDGYSRHLRQIVRQRIEASLERLRQDVPSAYWLLCLGSVYRRSVAVDFWLNMLAPLGLDRDQQEMMLDALRDRYLVEELIQHDQLYLRQHNLIRSIALRHLRDLRSQSDQLPNHDQPSP